MADGGMMEHEDDERKPQELTQSWRYCLHIAYFGTGFVGWQRQNETSKTGMGSVQELVEDAITDILEAPRRINVTSVSRTDAGTHALYQYGTIRLGSKLPMTVEDLKDSLNKRLPESVVVHDVTLLTGKMAPSRIRSRYKKYIYYIQQGSRPDLNLGKYSWFIGKKIDVQRLHDALSFLVGTHDFRSFSQGLQKAAYAEKSTVRTLISAKVRIRRHVEFSLDPAACGNGVVMDDAAREILYKTTSSSAEAQDQKRRKVNIPQVAVPVHFICVELIANGFLRHMVRRIMGTIRPIGEGTYPPIRMKQVLDREIEPGPSAPTKGLWLHRTWLTQEDWDNDDSREE